MIGWKPYRGGCWAHSTTCAIGITATAIVVCTPVTWRNNPSVPLCRTKKRTAGTGSDAVNERKGRSGGDGADRANSPVPSAESSRDIP